MEPTDPPKSELEAELQVARELIAGMTKQLGISRYVLTQERQEKERLREQIERMKAAGQPPSPATP